MRKSARITLLAVGIVVLGGLATLGVMGLRPREHGPIDVFPRPGTPTASAETTISFRGIAPNEIGDIEVKGSRSGKH
ncbi:MAG: hypothetical protein ACRDN9_13605, partial [Streptosporangiaceae bacterium]